MFDFIIIVKDIVIPSLSSSLSSWTLRVFFVFFFPSWSSLTSLYQTLSSLLQPLPLHHHHHLKQLWIRTTNIYPKPVTDTRTKFTCQFSAGNFNIPTSLLVLSCFFVDRSDCNFLRSSSFGVWLKRNASTEENGSFSISRTRLKKWTLHKWRFRRITVISGMDIFRQQNITILIREDRAVSQQIPKCFSLTVSIGSLIFMEAPSHP